MEATSEFGVSEAVVQGLIGYGLTITVALLTACVIWGVVTALESMQKKKKAAAVEVPTAVSVSVEPEPEPEDDTARHVAAIAAAVYTAIGAHRLVYIGEARTGATWASTGRVLHQTSHMPKRSPQG